MDRLLAIFYALLNLESGVEGGDSSSLPPLTTQLIGSVGALCALGLLLPSSSALAAGGGGGGGNISATSLIGESSATGAEDPLFNPRYRCLLNLETARTIAKSVDIDLDRYLLDFL